MSNSNTIAILFSALILLCSSVAFAEWNQTFEPVAVNSYMTQAGAKFVVIASGESPKSGAAAKSLETALRSGSASMVMDGKSLGDVSALDDEAIIEKAKNLPVDHIAIVRVFEASGDGSDSVVVIVYDKAGETKWALSGTEGQPIAANAETQGVPVAASKSVADVTATTTSANEESRAKFDEEFIWFADYVGVSSQTGAVMASWTHVYQGKYKKPIDGEEFYLAVGRPDLAEQYSSNSTRATIGGWLGGFGVVGILGFGTWWLTGWLINSSSDTDDYNTTTPMVLTGVSTGLFIAGIIVSPSELHPVEPSEARKLADEQNKKLRRELGLPENYMPFASPGATQGTKFNVSLGGEGVQFRLRYDF